MNHFIKETCVHYLYCTMYKSMSGLEILSGPVLLEPLSNDQLQQAGRYKSLDTVDMVGHGLDMICQA